MRFDEIDRTNLIESTINQHIKENTSLHDVMFRAGSAAFNQFFNTAREMLSEGVIEVADQDRELLETDIGKFAQYNNETVPLDLPMEEVLAEAEYQGRDVELNKPKRGGSKKFYVYVKDPKTGNVKKVSFGAAGGGGNLAVKLKDPEAKAAFAARHNCEQANDKTKASYWSCRLPRYAKSLGLSGGGKWW